MRKIIVFNMISLDGYFAGPNGEIDWHNTDSEFGKFANEQTQEFGTLIFGRVTYEVMKNYWPTPQALKDDPIVANVMNNIPKIVYSKTLKTIEETPTWKNITLFHDINPEEIKRLKEQSGPPSQSSGEVNKDIAIFGSGTIVQQFTNLGLIDEYWLMVNPIILGEGKPLFKDVEKRMKLKLLKTRTFKNGNILLYYSVR